MNLLELIAELRRLHLTPYFYPDGITLWGRDRETNQQGAVVRMDSVPAEEIPELVRLSCERHKGAIQDMLAMQACSQHVGRK